MSLVSFPDASVGRADRVAGHLHGIGRGFCQDRLGQDGLEGHAKVQLGLRELDVEEGGGGDLSGLDAARGDLIDIIFGQSVQTWFAIATTVKRRTNKATAATRTGNKCDQIFPSRRGS